MRLSGLAHGESVHLWLILACAHGSTVCSRCKDWRRLRNGRRLGTQADGGVLRLESIGCGEGFGLAHAKLRPARDGGAESRRFERAATAGLVPNPNIHAKGDAFIRSFGRS